MLTTSGLIAACHMRRTDGWMDGDKPAGHFISLGAIAGKVCERMKNLEGD